MATERTRSRSTFSGVFTLRTQEEANEPAAAVKALVERGANIFTEVNNGTAGEIEAALKSVVRLSQSFQELTLDAEEGARCKQVVEGMAAADKGIQEVIQAQRSNPNLVPTAAYIDDRNARLAKHMEVFLARTADLCDMMEDNQNKRGLMIVKQAAKHLTFLRDPRFVDFDGKLKQFKLSCEYVVNYLENREGVVETGSNLQLKLSTLRTTLIRLATEVADRSIDLHNSPDNLKLQESERIVVAKFVECLKDAGKIFASKGATIETSYGFTVEKMETALNSLSAAVHNGEREAATSQARIIVEALKEKEEQNPEEAAELKKATRDLVAATKEALDAPSTVHEAELEKVMANVKQQFLAIAAPTSPKTNLLAASTQLTKSLRDLTCTLSPVNSPRNMDGSPRTGLASPRYLSPRVGPPLSPSLLRSS